MVNMCENKQQSILYLCFKSIDKSCHTDINVIIKNSHGNVYIFMWSWTAAVTLTFLHSRDYKQNICFMAAF